jgi:hypothetical protein
VGLGDGCVTGPVGVDACLKADGVAGFGVPGLGPVGVPGVRVKLKLLPKGGWSNRAGSEA